MKIVVAVDSFKGSLSSLDAGGAVRDGILRAFPDAEVEVCPLADGGEGTAEALTLGMGGSMRTAAVTGPLGEQREARYGVLRDGRTAVMEMAEAAGITLLGRDRLNPMRATTCGVGEMILDAVRGGCRRFIIGIGGSATNDGGAGMLQALGFGLLDAEGRAIPSGAAGLASLAEITDDHVPPVLRECRFRIACDVRNPLCGARGASAVFGPQKGADAETVSRMDANLARFAALTKRKHPEADPDAPGSGAAGGLGFAFSAYLHASLERGVRIVLEESDLAGKVKDADLVITGEGCLDGQTVMGKAPAGAAEIAKRYGKPVLALAGTVSEGAAACNGHGIDAFFPILQRPGTLQEAMDAETARSNLRRTAEQAVRLFAAGRR